ncbi:hypothetical protein [Deinococcus multiflagellatus]|uniref:CbtB-domain containing protein n=1 Tax=Deinococcus multiflagellatus TaxID=1656887 RepID=A0ABW1ZH51_9DEIO
MSRERASRFARAHNPLQPPPLRAWHVLLALVLLGVMVGSVTASGLFGEAGRAGLGEHVAGHGLGH